MSQQRDKTPARRRFLRDAARSVAGLAGIGVLLGLQQKQSQARDGLALRPPGALAEGRLIAPAFAVVSVCKPARTRR